MPKSIFIVLTGGPGLYDPLDPDHDKAWYNYTSTVLLKAARKMFPRQKDEDVWWMLYKPAYEARWNDDIKAKDFRKKHVDDLRKQGFTSYVNKLEKRATEHGMVVMWLKKSADFWTAISGLSVPISRVWYFGHGSEDLWLVITHVVEADGSHVPALLGPESETAVKVSDIDAALRPHFTTGGSTLELDKTAHRFFGCNTDKFASKWSSSYKVWSEGFENTLSFSEVYTSEDNLPAKGTACVRKIFKPNGTLDSAT